MNERLGQDGVAAQLAMADRSQEHRHPASHTAVAVQPQFAAWGPPVQVGGSEVPNPFSRAGTKALQTVLTSSAALLILITPMLTAFEGSQVVQAPRLIRQQVVPGATGSGG